VILPPPGFLSLIEDLSPRKTAYLTACLNGEEADGADRDWPSWAHTGQLPAGGDWETWVIMAGRGFGKTLAGAQWIAALVEQGKDLSIALVGATLDDARRVMIEGRSGLLAVAGDLVLAWNPSLRRLSFKGGSEATLFSGASPEMLRGPEFDYAWCDELAKWAQPQETWDMLQLGLRRGTRPQALVTTTPGAGPVLRAIMDGPGVLVTQGSTRRNPHLPAAYKARMERMYAGTRLGRQELEGELLPEAGALWSVELIERCRATVRPPEFPSGLEGLGEGSEASDDAATTGPPPAPPINGRGVFTRTLIAVDPPSGDGTCGIIACAREGEGQAAIAHVLADHSVTARTPEGWAGAVAAAAAAHATTEVIAEANQGGKMVKAVLLTANPDLRVRLVHATQGKTTRAEPVAHLFEAGKAVLHGRMAALEAQLLGMIAGGGYEGPGKSPDRADAMVWGVGEVMREVGAGAGVWVLGITLARVDDIDDFHRIVGDAIDQDVVRMDHRLARSVDAAGTKGERMAGQSLRARLDRRLQAFRRGQVALGDIADDGFKIVERASTPDQARHAPRLASMIARTRAIASSWGMAGRSSASDAATFASSQRRCASACSTESNSETMGERSFTGSKVQDRPRKRKVSPDCADAMVWGVAEVMREVGARVRAV
jgi:phage terminase large subunit-like protein